MKKKILLLFSLVILCVPLMGATIYDDHFSKGINSGCFDEQLVTAKEVKTYVIPKSITFSNGMTSSFSMPFDRNLITQNFTLEWTEKATTTLTGWQMEYCCWEKRDLYSSMKPIEPHGLGTTSVLFSKKAIVTLYGIDASGTKIFIRAFNSALSGTSFHLEPDEFIKFKKYNKFYIGVEIDPLETFKDSELNLPVRLVDWSSVKLSTTTEFASSTIAYIALEFGYQNFSPVPTISNSGFSYLNLSGEPDTKVSGLQELGGSSHDHALDISQAGTGVVIFNQCNLTSLLVSLINVDFTCQTITGLVLLDASGNVKKTFSTADYATVGSNQIQLSLSNVIGIADNDKLQIALTNSCTTNHESDYSIILSTEGKKVDGKHYANEELFPGGSNKVPIAITQKGGTKWCDNSSAFFFDVSGLNGYTNLNFTNTTPGGGSFSVAKGQSGILGTANYYKCLTNVNIPIPATKMPKAPVISDLQYCDGTNFTLPINNPSDYTTETFRLLLDGAEKFGWQGTKSFTTNLGKVGSASAVVESNNGECQIASNTATINSRIQPIALAFNGSLSYYTEQVNTTIVQTTQQDGVTYKIFKDGSNTSQDSWIGTKAQTLTKGSYRITAENANASCSAETNLVIVEKDLNIGSAWTTDELSFCQLEGTKDLNSFVSFNGASSVVFTSTAGLSITGSNVDLASSTAGTYVITCTAIKDGVTKVFTKNFTVKPKANNIAISLLNSTDFACNTDNPQLQVTTDYPGYSYSWSKGATVQSGTDRTNTIPLSKAEGALSFTVVATATNGCTSSPSPALVLTKNNLTADINFTSGIKLFCQSIAGTANIFDDLTGSDRIAVSLEQSGWTYNVTTSSSDMILLNRNQIDLERSKAGTYTITMAYSQNGCTKTITKQYTIKQMPSNVTVTLDNASTIECDLTNANAQVHASNSNYTYNWTKNGVALTDNTQAVSVPVSKADGLTTIYAHPVLDGCVGLKSNEVSLTKRYVVADATFSTGVTEYCQKTGGSIDIFTELSGTDKIAVVNSQSGYTWTLTPSGTGLKVKGSTINLETSQAGTYTVAMTISKDGCSKSITKDIMIRQRPADFTVLHSNSNGFTCNTSDAAMVASVTSYSYKWYKGGENIGSGTTISIPTTKADFTDASRTVYAIGTAENGCETNPSTSLILPLKKFIEANLDYTPETGEFCQTVGTTLDMRTLLNGSDKNKVVDEQDGYTWDMKYSTSGMLFADSKNSIINLEKSFPQNYTTSLNIHKDGCLKTITKDVKIKARPIPVDISLLNSDNLTCNNSDAKFKAAVSIYSYNWSKNGTLLSETSPNLTLPIAKADGLVSVSAIPVLDGCVGVKSNVIDVTKHFVEANFEFSSGTSAWCQKSGTTVDLFSEITGSDKLAIQQKQNGWDWSISGTNLLGLVYSGSVIDLEQSKAGNYNINFILTKDGCSKTFVKSISIKQKPVPVTITLQNGGTVECDSSIPDALLNGDNKDYLYNWYKNGVKLTDKTQSISIPVSKTDGIATIYAVPQLGYCLGDATNSVVVKKRFVEADFGFINTPIQIASKDEKINLFDYTVGKDKEVIINQTGGYTYSINFTPIKQTAIATTDGTVVPATGLQTGDTKYTLNVVVSKDGCSKTLSKESTIQSIPRNITIDFATKKDIQECSSNNYISVIASNPTLKYKWFKNDILVPGDTYQASIEVFKSDKEVKIYAIPSTTEGVAGYKTNDLLTTKRYVTADVQLDSKTESFCSVLDKKVNIFDYVRGADKAAVLAGQYGYTYTTSGDCGLAVAENKYIDFDNSLSEDNAVYNVSLTVAQNGCTSTQSKSITILRRPEDITIELLSKASNTAIKNMYCAGDSLELKASTSATNATYNWYKGTELITKTTVPSLKYKFVDPTGTINLSATSVFENGCQSTASNVISVSKKDVKFDIALDPSAVAYCPETKKINLFDYVSGTDKNNVMTQSNNCTYEFSATGNNGLAIVSYSFLDLDNSTSSTSPYILTMNVNKEGCMKSFSKNVSIKPRPATPLITLTSNSELRYCGGDVVTLTDKNAQTGTYYKWTVNGTDVSGSSSSILKYTTDQASEIGVQAISYFNSNSCPSKASDVLKVSNVVPRVDIKLINTNVTVNDLIQFYVFESTASKSIKLTATRVSDKTVTDLPYTREGNVITLSGILPIGEYSFNAIAENALTGYCSQNIAIANSLTVTNSTREGSTNSGVIPVSSSDEIAMKTIYDEYMAQLKKGEVHSILLPILTASNEPAKLSVFTTDDNESVIIRVVDIQGHVISSRTEFLLKGENDFTIKGDDKPVVPGMYLINIDYSKAHKSETLKGLVK